LGQIFISYKSVDRAYAQRLAVALEARGHSVWWDRELRSGTQYRDAIANELKSCNVVIVIWTPRSVSSPWVRDEADFASRHRKLLPVIVRESDLDTVADLELPLGFGQIHAEDLTGWDGSADAPVIGKIHESIAAIVDSRWSHLLRAGNFARRDAARFFRNISTEIGGLPFSSLFFGSLALACVGSFITICGFLLRGQLDSVLMPLYLLPVTLGSVAFVRTLFQFSIITSGQSSRNFFDNSFTLVFMFSAMLAILAIAWVEYDQDLNNPMNLLIYGPLGSLLILVFLGFSRAALTGARLLFSRL